MVDLKRTNPIFGFTSGWVKFISNILKNADNMSDSSDRKLLHRVCLQGGSNWHVRDEPTGAKPQAWARQLLEVYLVLARYQGIDTANEFMSRAFQEGLARLISKQSIQQIFPNHVDDVQIDVKLNIWQRADFTNPPEPLDLTVVNQFTYDDLISQLEFTNRMLEQSHIAEQRERESRQYERQEHTKDVKSLEARLSVTRQFVAPSKLEKCQMASRQAVEESQQEKKPTNKASEYPYMVTNDETAFRVNKR